MSRRSWKVVCACHECSPEAVKPEIALIRITSLNQVRPNSLEFGGTHSHDRIAHPNFLQASQVSSPHRRFLLRCRDAAADAAAAAGFQAQWSPAKKRRRAGAAGPSPSDAAAAAGCGGSAPMAHPSNCRLARRRSRPPVPTSVKKCFVKSFDRVKFSSTSRIPGYRRSC